MLASCAGTSGHQAGANQAHNAPAAAHGLPCGGTVSNAPRGPQPASPQGLIVPKGFAIETIAHVGRARELVALPNGDLLVGTLGNQVFIVPDAESNAAAGEPQVFANVPDKLAAGLAFSVSRCEIYVASANRIWLIPYRDGDLQAQSIRPIASVRTGPIAPDSDGDVHVTTSVAYDETTSTLYTGVGSSCNACTEADDTRASILQMKPDGSAPSKRATRIRNAIAMTIDPATGALWVGDAGQDDLPFGHPYEFLDDVSAHAGVADYGWPECEEDHHAYAGGADCAHTVAPRVELPAYSTIIGATFYPLAPKGRFAFPAPYRGALFAATHGSWHQKSNEGFAAKPQIVFIAMHRDQPVTPVDWNDPSAQWKTFVGGFQYAGTQRRGRPTGIAVGIKGTLFVADDAAALIYRIRPVL